MRLAQPHAWQSSLGPGKYKELVSVKLCRLNDVIDREKQLWVANQVLEWWRLRSQARLRNRQARSQQLVSESGAERSGIGCHADRTTQPW